MNKCESSKNSILVIDFLYSLFSLTLASYQISQTLIDLNPNIIHVNDLHAAGTLMRRVQ